MHLKYLKTVLEKWFSMEVRWETCFQVLASFWGLKRSFSFTCPQLRLFYMFLFYLSSSFTWDCWELRFHCEIYFGDFSFTSLVLAREMWYKRGMSILENLPKDCEVDEGIGAPLWGKAGIAWGDTWNRLFKTVSRWLLSISRVGDCTTSLGQPVPVLRHSHS